MGLVVSFVGGGNNALDEWVQSYSDNLRILMSLKKKTEVDDGDTTNTRCEVWRVHHKELVGISNELVVEDRFQSSRWSWFLIGCSWSMLMKTGRWDTKIATWDSFYRRKVRDIQNTNPLDATGLLFDVFCFDIFSSLRVDRSTVHTLCRYHYY